MTTPWRHHQNVARVDSENRAVLLNLDRPDQPPVILDGVARLIFDAVDGTRDTDEVIAVLQEQFPHAHRIDEDVRACLESFADVGIIES